MEALCTSSDMRSFSDQKFDSDLQSSMSSQNNNGHRPFKITSQGLSVALKDSRGSSSAITNLPWQDIAGCHIVRGSPCTMHIYTYSHNKKNCRARRIFKLHIPSFTYAKQCQASLMNVLCRAHEFQLNEELWSESLSSLDESSEVSSHTSCSQTSSLRIYKPILTLVNPTSGAGKAYDIFLNYVNPILADADIPYQLVVTRSLDHVHDIIKNANLSSLTGILIVSGDGLVYEVINSLMARQDSDEAIKTPLGIIPAGSGNGIVSSLLSCIGEFRVDALVLHSAFALVKSNPSSLISLDIGEVNLPDQVTMYSSLSITWGLIADVDCESEKFRVLGSARFGVVIATKLLSIKGFKQYRARLSYCPMDVDVSRPLPDLSQPLPSSWIVEEGAWCTLAACQLSHLAEDFCPCPEAKPTDGLYHLCLISSPCSRRNLYRIISACSGNSTDRDLPGFRMIRTPAFRLEPLTQPGNLMVDGEKVPYGPIQARVLPGKARVMYSHPTTCTLTHPD